MSTEIIHALSEAAKRGVEVRGEAMSHQQLVARIKRSSKYWGQTAPNEWFDVRVVTDDYYQLRGNQNNYRFSDVVMGIRIGGVITDFKTGRSSK